MIEIRVPGFIYHECLDPQATDVPREMGWPEASMHRVGRGRQFRYMVTPAQAAEIISHISEMGEAWSYGVDDPSVGRRMVAWVADLRMREQAV